MSLPILSGPGANGTVFIGGVAFGGEDTHSIHLMEGVVLAGGDGVPATEELWS